MSDTFAFDREAPQALDWEPTDVQAEEDRSDGFDMERRIHRRNEEGKVLVESREAERLRYEKDPPGLAASDEKAKREWLAEHFGIGTPEEFEGDLYIARERQKPKAPLDRMEVQSMRDQQFEVDDFSDETVLIRANAQKACAACPGHCCRAFTMGWWPTGEGELAQRILDKRTLLGLEVKDRPEMQQNGMPDRYHALVPTLNPQQRAEQEEILFTYEFFKKHLITLDAEQKIFTCKAFNHETRRCEAYAERPLLCRRFVCGPATTGVPPDMGRMLSEQPRVQAMLDAIQK